MLSQNIYVSVCRSRNAHLENNLNRGSSLNLVLMLKGQADPCAFLWWPHEGELRQEQLDDVVQTLSPSR